jgi:hypothetical protein
MPRRRASVLEQDEASQQHPVIAGVVLHPHAVFLADQVRQMLHLKGSSLRREIREGRLRVCKRCGRHYFTGQQLLDWLRGGELPSQR